MTDGDPLASLKRLMMRDPAAAIRAAKVALDRSAAPDLTVLLAAAHRRAGDPDAAIAVLLPMAAAHPNAWGIRFELGMALAMTGDPVAGLAELERAIALHPRATLARHARDDLGALTGQGENAVPLAFLDDPELRVAIANFLDETAPIARDSLATRFGLDGNDIAAICVIADVGIRLGRHQAAAALLQDAVGRAPAYAPARFRLAEALHRSERDAEALAVIGPLFAERSSLAARSLRGAILLRLGREGEALLDLQEVAYAASANSSGQLALGHALRSLGRREEALGAYRRAIAIAPASGEAYWSIANLKNASFTADEMVAMQALDMRTDLGTAARAHIGFALGKACEQVDDFATAFAHYARANALRREHEPYDAAAQEAFIDRMIETCDARFFAERRGFGDPGTAPIFVVGMPRSGSTLVEQILATHSRVEGLSELPEVTILARSVAPYPEGLSSLSGAVMAGLGAAYLDRAGARRRTHTPRFVDKFPGDAFHIGLIALMLPGASIIDVRRDPRDCCVSLYVQSFAAGQAYSYDLVDLARHYAGYARLMRHFADVLPGRVLRVDYEALVDDVEGETRRLLDHCGLAFEPQCLRFFDNARAVRTASSEQVRQPIYRDAIGRWRRFEPWLGPLLDTLSDHGI